MTIEKLTLVTATLNGITTRSVDHPEHGPLIMASDLVRGLGYAKTAVNVVLNKAEVPETERVLILGRMLSQGLHTPSFIYSRANFLTRKGVNLVLMFSGKPIAQETRQWLAGDVMPAIADTGGYLLNEAARDTARADTRQTMPLPEHLGGAYEALITEKRKNIALEMQLIERLQEAATGRSSGRKRLLSIIQNSAPVAMWLMAAWA